MALQVPPGAAVHRAGFAPYVHSPPKHRSSVQATPSSHEAPGTQTVPTQRSPLVQALWSSQVPELGVFTQPAPATQASSVQAFPSSQSRGAPAQAPSLPQTSPAVHESPSLQVTPARAVCTQPDASQESSVHSLPSSQPAGPQLPPQQV